MRAKGQSATALFHCVFFLHGCRCPVVMSVEYPFGKCLLMTFKKNTTKETLSLCTIRSLKVTEEWLLRPCNLVLKCNVQSSSSNIYLRIVRNAHLLLLICLMSFCICTCTQSCLFLHQAVCISSCNLIINLHTAPRKKSKQIRRAFMHIRHYAS
jgi:hypothetical protein